jgi:hypothetical protein
VVVVVVAGLLRENSRRALRRVHDSDHR